MCCRIFSTILASNNQIPIAHPQSLSCDNQKCLQNCQMFLSGGGRGRTSPPVLNNWFMGMPFKIRRAGS